MVDLGQLFTYAIIIYVLWHLYKGRSAGGDTTLNLEKFLNYVPLLGHNEPADDSSSIGEYTPEALEIVAEVLSEDPPLDP